MQFLSLLGLKYIAFLQNVRDVQSRDDPTHPQLN